MQFTRTTAAGRPLVLHFYDRPVPENEFHVGMDWIEDGGNTSPVKPPEGMLDLHRHDYGAGYVRPEWRGYAFMLPGPCPGGDKDVLESHSVKGLSRKESNLVGTTSYQLQAVKEGRSSGLMRTGYTVLVRTADDRFVFGERGGGVASSTVCTVPAGVLWTPDFRGRDEGTGYNPLFDPMYSGLTQELAPGDDPDIRLIGYQVFPGENDFELDFVSIAETQIRLPDLRKMHEEALAIYQGDMPRDGRTPEEEMEARMAIANAGYANTDAWQHTQLIPFEPDVEALDKTLHSRSVRVKDAVIPLVDSGYGAVVALRQYIRFIE
jgi:hypothetical protein